jgi:hypothetical protein
MENWNIWGTEIHSSEFTEDLRYKFKDLIADKLDPEKARQFLQNEYLILDTNNSTSTNHFWLAIASVQREYELLEDIVKQKALEIIESGVNINNWKEQGFAAEMLEERENWLQNLKSLLLDPEKYKPKKIRKRSICPYQVGDVFYYQSENKSYYLFKVVDIKKDEGGIYCIALPLNYKSFSLPNHSAEFYQKLTPNRNYPKNSASLTLLLGWSTRFYKNLVKEKRIGLLVSKINVTENEKGTISDASIIDLANWEINQKWIFA